MALNPLNKWRRRTVCPHIDYGRRWLHPARRSCVHAWLRRGMHIGFALVLLIPMGIELFESAPRSGVFMLSAVVMAVFALCALYYHLVLQWHKRRDHDHGSDPAPTTT